MPILAVDIGGTFIKYATVTEAGALTDRGSADTPMESGEALVAAIGALYDAVPGCAGIAVSMPGIIDPATGYISLGGALRYNNGFPFREALEARCPTRIAVENDAKCAALAEAADGALAGVQNGMVLILGTMVGGGLILNGELYRGSHFAAGEVSYLITDRDGQASEDGVWGNRCGVPRLCRLYAEAAGLDPARVNGEAVFRGVNAHEPAALRTLERYASELAVQIFNLQNVFDPQRFAIGGGISAQPALLDAIRKRLKALYAACPYPVRRAEVVACKYRNDANLLGAYRHFLRVSPARPWVDRS